MTVEIHPIRSEADHEKAVAQIEALWGAEPGTEEYDALDVLATLVDKYETEHYPIDAPDPLSLICFHMEQNGYVQADLARVLGSRSRASEILKGKQRLSITHIRKLHADWRLPAEMLIREPAGTAASNAESLAHS